MSHDREGENSDRGQDVRDIKSYRVRRDDATAFRTAFLVLGGLVSLLGFFWVVTNGISENLRVEIRNERVDRINAINELRSDCRRR